jgi:antitoxin HigA-1
MINTESSFDFLAAIGGSRLPGHSLTQGESMTLPRFRITTHPGTVLLEEYIKPLALTQAALAVELGISTNRLNELVRGKRGITADTALRLARRFETSPEFWMNLQSAYELTRARKAMAASGD